jgi:hypothetical protein
MKRQVLIASAFALLLAGEALAFAQDAVPPAPDATSAKAAKADGKESRILRIQRADGPGPGFDRAFGPGVGPESPVIGDLRDLERLYIQAGRARELPALYTSVLDKSQDPRVRTYVYHQLARAQAAPANVDQAIATLRKSLDENLANEAKRREEMDKMRGSLEIRRADMAPPAGQ